MALAKASEDVVPAAQRGGGALFISPQPRRRRMRVAP